MSRASVSSTGILRRAGAALACALLAAASLGAPAYAWVSPLRAPGEPPCPPIPDAVDLALTLEERTRVEAGEIVVRMVGEDGGGARAQAVGYLDAHPAWLFEIATDADYASQLTGHAEEVQVLETHPDGKRMRALTDPSRLLPPFEYTLAVSYLEDGTGQCWSQVEGDFRKNEGSHSYLWDSERRQTLAVFTFEIALKGMLRVLPQPIVLGMTARELPDYMRALESLAARAAAEDPKRAARVARRWSAMQARFDGGELTGRQWKMPAAETAAAAIRQFSGDGAAH